MDSRRDTKKKHRNIFVQPWATQTAYIILAYKKS